MEELFIFPETQENQNSNQDFYIVNCSKCELVQQESFCNRVRNDWSILLVRAGSISFRDGHETVSKGEIYIFPPNAQQNFSYSKNSSYFWLFLSGKEVDFIIKKYFLY